MAVAPRSFQCPRCRRAYAPVLSCKTCVICRDDDGHLLDTFASDCPPIYDATRTQKLRDQYAEFLRRYHRHTERRKAMGYPDPDELGAMEARKEVKRLRELEEMYAAS